MKKNCSNITRRSMLQMAGVGAAVLALPSRVLDAKPVERAVTNGRINQSMCQWCFGKYWNLEQMCQTAKVLGLKSIELIGIMGLELPEDERPVVLRRNWTTLKKHGLIDAMHFVHGFVDGLNNPENWDMCLGALRDGIEMCAQFGFPNILTFTGSAGDIPPDVGAENCVTALKKIMGLAERKKVNICLEILNSRVAEEMKGHPGYQGDHTDYCMEIIKRVSSPRMKLLFDIYHVQVMDGDVISRIRQYKDYIGHYHTAGVPGRGELDDKQEINYRPIMEEIVRTGYTGYVGQEFIPTRDPLKGLREAVKLCDV